MRDRSDPTKSFQNIKKSIANFFPALVILLLLTIACGFLKSPLQNYSEKPFDSEEWLRGDPVERGRMFTDIYARHILKGRSRESVQELLGEPDKTQFIEGREVWLYYVEHSRSLPQKYFPVSFESGGKTFAGKIENGTISILVEK